MNLKRDIFTKCALLKRNYIFWILCAFNFFALAMFDNKTYFVVENYEQCIYRYNFQQVFIIFTCIFMIHLMFNEGELIAIRDYKIIYTKSVQQEIKSYAYSGIIMLVVGFVSGQFLAFIINFLLGGKVYIELFLVNIVIVIAHISVAILLIMGLRMLFVKDIVVYGIYYVWIFVSLISGNVYVSMPLTIRIVGIEEQGYYVTFGKELWLGRVLLIILALFIYKIGVSRFEHKISED